jgi:biotin transport system substrate-specific component
MKQLSQPASTADGANIQSTTDSLVLAALQIFAVIGLMAIAAHVKIYTAFTDVPFTFQTLIVLGAALTLPKARSGHALAGYLLLGLAGLPVFAGGAAGTAVTSGPTFGYILGFAAAGYGVYYARSLMPKLTPARTFALLLIGEILIFGLGIAWLVLGLNMPLAATLYKGFVVFLPYECLKIVLLLSLISIKTQKGL